MAITRPGTITGGKVAGRWHTFWHALAFVLGFSTVFVVLGASVAFVGYALNTILPTISRIGGLLLIAVRAVCDRRAELGG